MKPKKQIYSLFDHQHREEDDALHPFQVGHEVCLHMIKYMKMWAFVLNPQNTEKETRGEPTSSRAEGMLMQLWILKKLYNVT